MTPRKRAYNLKNIQKFRAIIQQIVSVIEDVDKMAVLLGGIPDSFETVATIVENESKADYSLCKEMIIAHARKLVQDMPGPSERANMSGTRDSTVSCSDCGRTGHDSSQCWTTHPELMPSNRGARGRGKGRGRVRGRGRGERGHGY